MRVVGERLEDGCIDSVSAIRLVLDQPLDEASMRRLAADDPLRFRPDFARPYFRIQRPRQFVVQGVFGSRELRITLLPSAPEDALAIIRKRLESDGETPPA